MKGSNHAVYLSNTESIEDNDSEPKKEVRFESKGKVQISLFTSPIEDNILQEMGFEPGFELEKFIDTPDFVANFLNTQEKVHFCSVHKAVIPIARLRVLLDQDDVGDMVSFRCLECSKCITCKKSQRSNAISLQEAGEQVIIEQSIKFCEESNTVIAKYPFLRDPIEFLTSKHQGSDNKNQALKVYRGQCKNSEEQKEGMRIVQKDLVEKDFMIRLTDMDEETQKYIKEAGFQHYNPWRIVLKEDSIFTPVRMVVDPTMTGFNLLLAKGENQLGYIFDIIIRNRCKQHAWSSDISKLYN